MKTKVLSPLARSIIRTMQARYSLAYIAYCFWPRSSRVKAKLLAGLISDFSNLYEINPAIVKHIQIYPFAGIPFLGSIFKGNGIELICAFDLIKFN